MEAHDQLEELVLDRATYEVKKDMGNKMAQIVYEGKWFTPLREAGPGICGCHTAVCDRRSKIQALQRKHHQSGNNFPILIIQ